MFYIDNNENVTKASTRNRQSSASEDKFLYGFLAGFVTAIGVIGLIGVILLCLVKKGSTLNIPSSNIFLTQDQHAIT